MSMFPNSRPATLGYATDDRSRWAQFEEEYARTHGELWQEYERRVPKRIIPGLY